MFIDPITLPPFPLSGLAMEPHMAAIQAWGMACAKVGAAAALTEVERMTKERVDKYETDMEGASGDEFSSAEWAAGAMLYHAKQIRRLRDQLTEGK